MILAILSCLLAFQSVSNMDDLSRTAIEDGAGNSWYDQRKEGFRVPDAQSLKRSDFEERNRSIYKPSPARNWNWNWGNWSFGIFFKIMAYLLLLVAVVFIIGGIIYLVNSERGNAVGRRKKGLRAESAIDQARLSDLPLMVEQTEQTPFEEADAARKKGDYSKAIVFLYIHMLLELDHAKKIRLQRGKTNGMYLRELRGNQTLRSILQKVSLAFEWVYFGKHPLTEQAFLKCWDQLPAWREELQLENQISSAAESTGVAAS